VIDRLLDLTEMRNGEADVRLHSVIVHETETGYGQCFRKDACSPRMDLIALEDIESSEAIRNEWPDPGLFDKLKRGERIANPERV
jgi:6-pyruvoyltetrahydropterin/6-carboxytetrahydropterin synthase